VNFAQLLIPDFSLILCGYLICRFTALNRSVWQQVDRMVYFFLFPVLLFHSIVKSPLDVVAASSLIGAGLSLAACTIALAYSLPYWPIIGPRLDRRDHAASAQVAFRFNSFIGLALAERLAGPQGLLLIAVLIGFCVPLFNIGAVWPMARQANTGFVFNDDALTQNFAQGLGNHAGHDVGRAAGGKRHLQADGFVGIGLRPNAATGQDGRGQSGHRYKRKTLHAKNSSKRGPS
jgi:hypothetical protein